MIDITYVGTTPIDKVKALPYVKEVNADKGVLEIIMEDAHIHLPDLLAHVPDVKCVETRVPTLNDVFIKLTGRDIRDDAEEEDSGGWVTQIARYTQRGK